MFACRRSGEALCRQYSTVQRLKNITQKLINAPRSDINSLRKELRPYAVAKINYQTGKPLLEDLRKADINGIQEILFYIYLNMDRPRMAAYVLLEHRDICDEVKISLAIDLLSMSRGHHDINDFKILFKLIKDFQLSEVQIKRIIDKAQILLESSKINDTIDGKFTLFEGICKYIGDHVVKKVDYSISYIHPENMEDIKNIGYKKGNGSGLNRLLTPKESLDRQLMFKYLHFAYNIIHWAVSKDDPSTVYRIWKMIQPFHNKIYNVSIDLPTNNYINNMFYYSTLSKTITILSKNKRYLPLIEQIIRNLPVESVKVSTELMTALIYHCARTGNETLENILIYQYNGDGDGDGIQEEIKYSEEQLHALFSSSIRWGRWERAKEIAGLIQTIGSINATDFNELIKSVLSNGENPIIKWEQQKGQIKETNSTDNLIQRTNLAWSMIQQNKPFSKPAFLTYLHHLVKNSQLIESRKTQLDEIYNTGLQWANDKNWWDSFHLSFFSYLRKFPLMDTVELYLRNTNDPILISLENGNPFANEIANVRFEMSDNLKRLALRNIHLRGCIEKSEVASWAWDELVTLRQGYAGEYFTAANDVSTDLIRDMPNKRDEIIVKDIQVQKVKDVQLELQSGRTVTIGEKSLQNEWK